MKEKFKGIGDFEHLDKNGEWQHSSIGLSGEDDKYYELCCTNVGCSTIGEGYDSLEDLLDYLRQE